MLDVAVSSLLQILSWPYIGYLLIGTMIGDIVGFIPGIGGYFALALLIPIVIRMDPIAAVTILLSAHSLISTGGSVCAVLFGVPGSGQNVSTVFDGYPMTQKGEGAEAVGASLMGSAVGGVIGALVMLLLIPVLRPLVLAFGSGEFFMMVMIGVACVVTMATESPLKAAIMAGLGFLLSFVGQDPVTGAVRYTFGIDYLWEGISLTALTMGKVALAMMVVMAVRGGAAAPDVKSGMLDWKRVWRGGWEVFRHGWLTVWSSLSGVVVGIIPGLGGEAAGLIAYAQAKQVSKRSAEFGKGCIEGVIAPEAANNSKEGGTLIPTISFGVPGSGAMAIMLGVLITMGIIPGTKMLTEFLPLTFSMVWTMVVGNIIGALVMMFGSNLLLKALALPTSALVSVISALIFVGSYSTSYELGDMITTFILGLVGYYAWRKHDYPIGPFLLGFVLGEPTERHFRITMATRGLSFLQRPISFVLAILFVVVIVYPLWSKWRKRNAAASSSPEETSKKGGVESLVVGFCIFVVLALLVVDTFLSIRDKRARVFPLIAGVPSCALMIVQLFKEFRDFLAERARRLMDRGADRKGEQGAIVKKELTMWSWYAGYVVIIYLFNFLIATPIFTLLMSRSYFKTRWRVAFASAAICWVVVYLFFEYAGMFGLGRGVLVSFQ